MERVNVVVLASLVAALALLGLRLFSPAGVPDFPPAPGAGRPAFAVSGLGDRKLPPARVAIAGGPRAGQRAPGDPPPPPGEKPSVRGSRGAGAPASDLIASAGRRRSALGAETRGGFATSDAVASDLLPGSALAARVAAMPSARGGGDLDVPQPDGDDRRTLEFVDDPPAPPADDVLLSIPFKGGVDAEGGSDPLSVDGLVSYDGGVEFTENARLSFPTSGNVNSEAGTISFELQPQWRGADHTDNSLVQIRDEHTWENALSLVKNQEFLRFIIIDSTGVERNVNITIDDWPANEVRRLTATWDESSMTLYVNGDQVGRTRLPDPLRFNDTTPMYIGSDYPGTSYAGAHGTIRNFTVYGHALPANEIARW